jgi:hypothetical protein
MEVTIEIRVPNRGSDYNILKPIAPFPPTIKVDLKISYPFLKDFLLLTWP